MPFAWLALRTCEPCSCPFQQRAFFLRAPTTSPTFTALGQEVGPACLGNITRSFVIADSIALLSSGLQATCAVSKPIENLTRPTRRWFPAITLLDVQACPCHIRKVASGRPMAWLSHNRKWAHSTLLIPWHRHQEQHRLPRRDHNNRPCRSAITMATACLPAREAVMVASMNRMACRQYHPFMKNLSRKYTGSGPYNCSIHSE